MLRFSLLVTACLFHSFLASSQSMETKFFVQPIPVFNLSTSSNEGIGTTQLNKLNAAGGLGAEIDLRFNKKFSLIPFAKYYIQKQKVKQTEMFNTMEQGSYFYNAWGYWNLNVGLMYAQRFGNTEKLHFEIPIGISYSMIKKYENKDGYHIITSQSLAYRYKAYPEKEDWTTGSNYFNIVLGARVENKIKKIGVFKFGLLLFLPLGNMPEYNFTSEIAANGMLYQTNTNTQSKQFNLELSILYQLFSFKVNQ